MADTPEVSDCQATPEAEPLPLPEPCPSEEPASMIDIHPPQHAAMTWRDFFIHMATIVLGLLIAIGLEQTVELVHKHRQAREARESIRQEMATNIGITQRDIEQFGVLHQKLSHNLDLLNSGATDQQALTQLNYQSEFTRRYDAAWGGAKIDGSLALIPSSEIAQANNYYGMADAAEPALQALYEQMDTAQAIVDHAKTTGKLTAYDRQMLLKLTTSGMGFSKFLAKFFSFQIVALNQNSLQ